MNCEKKNQLIRHKDLTTVHIQGVRSKFLGSVIQITSELPSLQFKDLRTLTRQPMNVLKAKIPNSIQRSQI